MIIKNINDFLKLREKLEDNDLSIESDKKYNDLIDFTKIDRDINNDDIKKMCDSAEKMGFYSICILPDFVSVTSSFLEGTNVKIVALISFPKGEDSSKEKIREIEKVTVNGADEVDVVLNYKLLEDDVEKLEDEAREIVEYCHREGIIVKFVIETGELTYQKLEKMCNICIDSNVDFVMTSTGKIKDDDTFEEKLDKVKFIRRILPDSIGIKISGGMRTLHQIKQSAQYVDRIGTSFIPK